MMTASGLWRTPILIGIALLNMAIGLVLISATTTPAYAITAEEMLANPVLEERARNLSKQLRCLVCQNQSIDDSDADLARDLRREVRSQIAAGTSDDAIIDQLRAKYGDYVLLNPPLDRATLFLWLSPLGFILLGGLIVMMARRQRGATIATELDAAERARIQKMLARRDSENRPKT
ncbi:cytochrome c-type biogenesis protein [Candidatus Ponderosibacter sp. Uisw_141_02]|uniref:cytochrome c-type biogenesis protein n=1 Tax=Candidatus Ponderosibacter sp. Uisw_141_02 TaxID=3231000 RepID=UPI003D597A92